MKYTISVVIAFNVILGIIAGRYIGLCMIHGGLL
jgi:hypothetical protein